MIDAGNGIWRGKLSVLHTLADEGEGEIETVDVRISSADEGDPTVVITLPDGAEILFSWLNFVNAFAPEWVITGSDQEQ
jgi:hypothetical protein